LNPEINTKYKHRRGTVAMAREYRKDLNPNKLTSAFEFYIIQGTDELSHLDGEHTIIGEVISGMSTVDKLAKVKTGSDQMPTVDVRMKIRVIQ
jgi:cyclophilin family peptidyl-prolyl cis-trans isomerase